MEHTVFKVSQLNGKRIVEQSSGSEIATVKDLVLDTDGRRVAGVIIDSGGLFSNSQRAIRWSSVTAVGDVIIVQGPSPIIDIKEDAELSDLIKLDRRISGMSIISEASGENLGSVSDVTISDRGDVLGYEVGGGFLSSGKKGFLPAEHLRTVGKDAIIATSPGLMDAPARERAVGAGYETGEIAADDHGSSSAPMGYEDHTRE